MKEGSLPITLHPSHTYFTGEIAGEDTNDNGSVPINEAICLSSFHHNSFESPNSNYEYRSKVVVGPLATASSSDLTILPIHETKYSGLDPTALPQISDEKSATSQHFWCQTGAISTSKSLNHLIVQHSINNVTTFFCGWNGCAHPVGFSHKAPLITHIRSVHLQEKPFRCTTCGTDFSRKQEAIRHVNAMNNGKKYKCSFCQKSFVRKHTRDCHEDTCAMCEKGQSSFTKEVSIKDQD